MTSPSIDPHADARAQLEGYVHALLDAASVRRLEAHLADCPACAAAAREERRLYELLGAAPSPAAQADASPGFEARFLRRFRAEVRAEVRAQARSEPWWARLFSGYRWTAWAGAAIAAAAAVVLLWPGVQPGSERGATPDNPTMARGDAEPTRELLSKIELLQHLELATNLDVLESVSPEELDAIAELPELGG